MTEKIGVSGFATGSWGLRAFPLRRHDETQHVWNAIVPRNADVAAVRRGASDRLELVALVLVAADGSVRDNGRAEVAISLLCVGDDMGPVWVRPAVGPRLIGPVPPPSSGWAPWNPEEDRAWWAYLVASGDLPGGSELYADEFEVIPSSG